MSFGKSSSKKEKKLSYKISDLLRENKSLRKTVSQLRKIASKADLTLEKKSLRAKEESYNEKYAIEECPQCRGEIREFSVMGITYRICQTCKTRKKIK